MSLAQLRGLAIHAAHNSMHIRARTPRINGDTIDASMGWISASNLALVMLNTLVSPTALSVAPDLRSCTHRKGDHAAHDHRLST